MGEHSFSLWSSSCHYSLFSPREFHFSSFEERCEDFTASYFIGHEQGECKSHGFVGPASMHSSTKLTATASGLTQGQSINAHRKRRPGTSGLLSFARREREREHYVIWQKTPMIERTRTKKERLLQSWYHDPPTRQSHCPTTPPRLCCNRRSESGRTPLNIMIL